MHTKTHSHSSLFGIRWSPANAALIILLTLLFLVFLILFITLTVQPAQGQAYQAIYTFSGGRDGGDPQGLTIDRAGNFYGTANTGGNTGSPCGAPGCGTVYKLSHRGAGWVLTTLYRFSGSDGQGPTSRVIFGPDGGLYGVTWLGGSADNGTVFNLKPGPSVCPNATCSWKETVLHSFGGFSSDYPRTGSCSLQKSQSRTRQHSPAFHPDVSDGSEPSGDVVFDNAGNLYGTTPWGGSGPASCGCGFPCGIVYQLTASDNGWQENILYNFQGGQDGGNPESGVILDNAGNLYGTTLYGAGSGCLDGFGCGMVFELTRSSSGWMETVLHRFQGGNDGGMPFGGLVFDQTGNLYGTTSWGGEGCGGYDCGTAFELAGAGTFTTIYSFSPGGPVSSLVMDAAGNLYGTAPVAGAYGHGSVFKLTPGIGGWSYTDLYDFTGGTDGSDPSSVLIRDADGNLWGTASGGGAYGVGVIFEITP